MGIIPNTFKMPKNIDESINMFNDFIDSLNSSFNLAIMNSKTENDKTKKLIGGESLDDIFDYSFNMAFKSLKFYDWEQFTNDIYQFVLLETNIDILKSKYSLINLKINNLKTNHKKIECKFERPYYNTINSFNNIHLLAFLKEAKGKTDVKQKKVCISNEEIYYGIQLQITKAENRINEIFSLKNLNKKSKTMKIDNHSDSNRKKVAKAILKFWQYSPKQFKSMDLINFVKAETGIEHIFFDTILRNMRQLKQDEKINYNCPIRKDMIYIKV